MYSKVIIAKNPEIGTCFAKFLSAYFEALLTFCGRATWTNLGRYGDYSERTFRRYAGTTFCFAKLNLSLLKDLQPTILAIDATTIGKAGTTTWGLGKFWSSCDGRVIAGIEYSCLALINPDRPGAFHLSAAQTPPQGNRMDFYVNQLKQAPLPQTVNYVVADGYYAKIKFCKAVLGKNLHLITRLRKDAQLHHLPPPKTGKRGRPRLKGDRIAPNDFTQCLILDDGTQLRSQLVWVQAFKQVCLVVAVRRSEKMACLLVSTDLTQAPEDVFRFYKARFQHELLFRDAKQHTGLGHCQARNQAALGFHANASLTTVNLARLDAPADAPFSLASSKRLNLNRRIARMIFRQLKLNPDDLDNQDNLRAPFPMGVIAP